VVRIGVAAVAVASLIFLGVHFSNPGNPGNANGPLVNEDNSQPKAAPFRKEDRKAVHNVLRECVLTAVDRQDVVGAGVRHQDPIALREHGERVGQRVRRHAVPVELRLAVGVARQLVGLQVPALRTGAGDVDCDSRSSARV